MQPATSYNITFAQMFGPYNQGICILVTINSVFWSLVSQMAFLFLLLRFITGFSFIPQRNFSQLMSLFKTDATRTLSVAVPNMVGQLWWLLDCDWPVVELTDNFNPARSLAHYSLPPVSCTSETTCRVVVVKQPRERRQYPGQPKLAFSFQ